MNPLNHPNCPRCKGQGFYLKHEGQGYMRDGSFSHNIWADCICCPNMNEKDLPKSLEPKPTYHIITHPNNPKDYYYIIMFRDTKGNFGRPTKINQLGLDGIP